MVTIMFLLVILLLIVLFSAVWKIHPVPVLLGAGLVWGLFTGLGVEASVNKLAEGFGNTMKGIGLIIIAGTVVGLFMERRGALARLAEAILKITGEKQVHTALAGIGYMTSIAIFCDSAFVILNGLAKNLCRKAKIPIAVGVTALALGLFSTHCLVPPMPGPVAAANLLGADFGLTIVIGLLVAASATITARFFAFYVGKNVQSSEESFQSSSEDNLKEVVVETNHSVPLFIAALPITIPLLMIVAGSFYAFSIDEAWQLSYPRLTHFMTIIHLPVVALTAGVLLAIFFLGRVEKEELSVGGPLGKAISQAANILVITSAGGAFGEVLRTTDIINGNLTTTEFGPWTIGLLITVSALMKTAQGSSTVAVLTTAGIFAPLLEPIGLGTPLMRALSVAAIGSGAMLVSHTNDSYFWVVTQLSGLNIRQGLRLQTLGTLCTGLTASITVMFLSWIFTLWK